MYVGRILGDCCISNKERGFFLSLVLQSGHFDVEFSVLPQHPPDEKGGLKLQNRFSSTLHPPYLLLAVVRPLIGYLSEP